MRLIPFPATSRAGAATAGQDGGPRLPLVLAGSLAATPAMWSHVIPLWRRHRDLYALAYPGHGAPVAPDAPATVEGLATQALDALDAAGIHRFAFAGISLGALLGMALAARAPDRVEAAVLANCRYVQDDAGKVQWTTRIEQVAADGMAPLVQPTLARWLTETTRQRHPDRAALVESMISAIEPTGYMACAAAVRDFDGAGLLGRIRCPVLAISGESDLAAPPALLAALAAQLTDASHLMITGAAHIPCLDQPERFAAATDNFFFSNAGGPPASR